MKQQNGPLSKNVDFFPSRFSTRVHCASMEGEGIGLNVEFIDTKMILHKLDHF